MSVEKCSLSILISVVSENKKIGDLGEDLACRFLVKHGFLIKDRNYQKKWSEIDIIAEKNKKIHFIEVKSVSYDTNKTKEADKYHPSENMHPKKQKSFSKIIETYISSNKMIEKNARWQIDVIFVCIDKDKKIAKIKYLKDIVLNA